MIRVTVEFWPHGNKENARTIGRMFIANDGTGTHDIGSYRAAYCGDETLITECKVGHFERDRGVWQLIKAVLDA